MRIRTRRSPIFGHSDPTGDEDYNKVLSGRRAEAIYAVLTHDVARWERLYTSQTGGDNWGAKNVKLMLEALGYTKVTPFQKDNALSADGVAGPKTRAVLFARYFQFLFPVPLGKDAFLGRGADPEGKADFQGCGEFNPAMVFSAARRSRVDQGRTRRRKRTEPPRADPLLPAGHRCPPISGPVRGPPRTPAGAGAGSGPTLPRAVRASRNAARLPRTTTRSVVGSITA